MALPRLLDSRRVRRVIGLALAAKGLLGLLAPRLTARVVARLSLREVYENPGDLEPRDTYADLIRDFSLGLLVFGVLTALRASATGSAPDTEETASTPDTEETASAADTDESADSDAGER